MPAFDFTSALSTMRTVVHDTMSIPAEYQAPGQFGRVPVRVRWHDRLVLQGNMGETGYADVIEGIDRAIFSRDQLSEKGITLQRLGTIHLPAAYNGVVLTLDALEKTDGPVNIVWKVTR